VDPFGISHLEESTQEFGDRGAGEIVMQATKAGRTLGGAFSSGALSIDSRSSILPAGSITPLQD
jgi:hypothetical protein